MQIFGLGPPAQVIVLQGLSTYTALASAYFFARPVLRGQMSQGRLDLLENLDASDPRMEPLLSKSKEILNTKLLKDRPAVRRGQSPGRRLPCWFIRAFFGGSWLTDRDRSKRLAGTTGQGGPTLISRRAMANMIPPPSPR